MQNFTGTGVAMLTPFNSKGEVDYPSLRKLTDFIVKGGVDYLVLLGTTAETPTLSSKEKYKILETIIEANDKRVPIMIGAGGNNTKSVIDEIHLLEDRYKPDGFLSVVPYYNRPSQEGLFQHFGSIAQSTELPIILYNVPSRTGTNLLADTVLRLSKAYSNIAGIKESSGDIDQCMEIISNCPNEFLLISGDDKLALPLMSIGGKGVISVIGNAFPNQIGNLIKHALDGNFYEAKLKHYELLSIMDLAFQEGNPTGIKAFLSELGMIEPIVRQPLAHPSNVLLESIKKIMVRF